VVDAQQSKQTKQICKMKMSGKDGKNFDGHRIGEQVIKDIKLKRHRMQKQPSLQSHSTPSVFRRQHGLLEQLKKFK